MKGYEVGYQRWEERSGNRGVAFYARGVYRHTGSTVNMCIVVYAVVLHELEFW
jgi:hypothetical protein